MVQVRILDVLLGHIHRLVQAVNPKVQYRLPVAGPGAIHKALFPNLHHLGIDHGLLKGIAQPRGQTWKFI
jgi:hypothetical protein